MKHLDSVSPLTDRQQDKMNEGPPFPSRTLFRQMASIEVVTPIPDAHLDAAAGLFLSALTDKLRPVFGTGRRALRALKHGFDPKMGLAAVNRGSLVGMLGVRTQSAGFIEVKLSTLKPFYGTVGSIWRLALLDFLQHVPVAGEAYIDGVAVSPAHRGRGIGSQMITALEAWAVERDLSFLSLEVLWR